ncbi:MAG: hypothetical protein MPJ51_15820 [Ruegeria sp.]|nr:hypothetical protein [Ruegeria sp.]
MFEVLIAFAVMTMVLSVVLPRQAEFLERSTASSKRAAAADVIYSRLSELGVARSLSLGESTDRVGDWMLYQHITPYAAIGSNIDLAEVVIEVTDKAGNVLFRTTEIRALK